MQLNLSKNLIWICAFIFLLAKLYLLIPVTLSLSIPRAGDDALVYLWKGKLINNNSKLMPALQDLSIQTNLPTKGEQNIQQIQSRIASRTLNFTMTPTYDFLSSIAIKSLPTLRLAYASLELIGLIIMTIAIGWFAFEVAGTQVASLTFLSMAFAILPKQGINSFIPSTMAMSFSLILWAYLWRSKEKANFFVISFAMIMIIGLHPIGKIYVALTPFVLWLRLSNFRALWSPTILKIFSISIVSILLYFIASKFIQNLKLPPSYVIGNIDIRSGFLINLLSIPEQLNKSFLLHNLYWVFGVVSSILFAPFFKVPKELKCLILGGFLALLASLAHCLPGYPGELFSRLWVVFFFLLALLTNHYLLIPTTKTILFLKIFFGVTFFSASMAWWVIKYVPDSMNERKEILVENIIHDQIDRIPNGNTILYAETDIALQASLLLGADRLGALAYPILKETYISDKIISEKKPSIVISMPYFELNSLSMAHAKKFIKRRQGLYFPYVSDFEIHRQNGTPLNSIYFHFIKDATAQGLMHWQSLGEKGEIIEQGNLKIKNEWENLKIKGTPKFLRITLPKAHIWLLGVRSSESKDKNETLWPWKEHWKIVYNLRNKKKKSIALDFKPEKLLEQYNSEYLKKYINYEDPVLYDNGGLVFFRTIFK